MIIHFLTALLAVPVLSLQTAPVPEPDTAFEPASKLTSEQRVRLRCSAAFALIAHDQSIGDEEALQWPKLEKRGREFFVRTTAGLIEQHSMTREQVAQITADEANTLLRDDETQSVMPSCMILLEASGL